MQLLYAVGIIIGLIVLWQGFEAFQRWQKRLRVKLEPIPPGIVEVEESRHPELGQVRIRPREEPKFEPVEARQVVEQPEIVVNSSNEPVLEEAVYEEPVLVGSPEVVPEAFMTAPENVADASVDSVELEDETRVPADTDANDIPVLLSLDENREEELTVEQMQTDMFANEPIVLPNTTTTGTKKIDDKVAALGNIVVDPVKPVAKSADSDLSKNVEKVISFYVVAKNGEFHGEELLRNILGYGLRYGDHSIFHRHEQPTGRGEILFSMAKAVEPGYFDLDTMSAESIFGVSFFLRLPGHNSITAFDLMLDTAGRLARDMNGDILDAKEEQVTRQLGEYYREQVQDYERQRLSNRNGV